MADDQTYNVYENSAIAFEKLSPKPGDMVTITVPADMDPRQVQAFAQLIQESITDNVPDGVTTLIVASNVQIEHWPKDMMARHGWYRLGG